MKKRGEKYCPRCGTPNNTNASYCIHCGYSFRGRRRKKLSLKTIILLIIIVLIAWILLRIFSNQEVVPPELMDLFRNITGNSTG